LDHAHSQMKVETQNNTSNIIEAASNEQKSNI